MGNVQHRGFSYEIYNTRASWMKFEVDTFACAVAVGPDVHELARLEDLLNGLCLHESQRCKQLVAVDDSYGKHDWRDLRSRFPTLSVIKSLREGRGDPWRGGLATNVLFGIRTAFETSAARFVVKLDTDSFVLSSFSSRMAGLLQKQRSIGIVGSCYEIDMVGNRVPPSTWKPNLQKHCSAVRLRRNPFPHVEHALWGRRRRIRSLLREAIRHGWQWGACAQGGGYAISRVAFERWTKLGFLSDPLLWLDTDLGEDVVMAVLCFASGLQIVDYNGRSEVFGVQYEGLGFEPEELKRRGYGVVHSVKAEAWEEEVHLRERLGRAAERT